MKETIDLGKNQLILTENKIQYKDGVIDQVILEPSEFRFGMRPIDLDPFFMGTYFKIQVKDDLDRVISLDWYAYLNFGKKRYLTLYEKVLDRLWEYYFTGKLQRLKKNIDQGGTVTLGNFQLSRDWIRKPDEDLSIKMDVAVILRKWDTLTVKSKFENNSEIRIDTFKEWNSPLIYALLDKIKGESKS